MQKQHLHIIYRSIRSFKSSRTGSGTSILNGCTAVSTRSDGGDLAANVREITRTKIIIVGRMCARTRKTENNIDLWVLSNINIPYRCNTLWWSKQEKNGNSIPMLASTQLLLFIFISCFWRTCVCGSKQAVSYWFKVHDTNYIIRMRIW